MPRLRIFADAIIEAFQENISGNAPDKYRFASVEIMASGRRLYGMSAFWWHTRRRRAPIWLHDAEDIFPVSAGIPRTVAPPPVVSDYIEFVPIDIYGHGLWKWPDAGNRPLAKFLVCVTWYLVFSKIFMFHERMPKMDNASQEVLFEWRYGGAS